jgi:hypothetical protein
MQFRLAHLITVSVIIAILCGLAFAAPPIIGTPLLGCFLAICPAIWFAGAFYARGHLQAFFIGGIAAGAVPFSVCVVFTVTDLITLYNEYMGIVPVYFPQLGDGSVPATEPTYWTPAIQSSAWMSNLLTLLPGPFSFTGGAISVLIYRFVASKQQPI